MLWAHCEGCDRHGPPLPWGEFYLFPKQVQGTNYSRGNLRSRAILRYLQASPLSPRQQLTSRLSAGCSFWGSNLSSIWSWWCWCCNHRDFWIFKVLFAPLISIISGRQMDGSRWCLSPMIQWWWWWWFCLFLIHVLPGLKRSLLIRTL